MQKKESYRNILPHFQQPGQAYFVTWCLKDAIAPKALKRYTQKLDEQKNLIGLYKEQKADLEKIEKAMQKLYSIRQRYLRAYDDLLNISRNNSVDLSKQKNLEIMIETLVFWNTRKLHNHAYCIMPNHVHWVFSLREEDDNGNLVYLQDIMHSVKRHTANKINKAEGRVGSLWQKESFDTTIRNERHLYYAIKYTLNNPVSAKLVPEWKKWPGCWYEFGCGDF